MVGSQRWGLSALTAIPLAREHAVLVTQLLGVMLLIFAVSVHLMASEEGGSEA